MPDRLLIFSAFLLFVLGTPGPSTAGEPAQYRTGLLDPRARAVPAAIQRGVFDDPDKHLESLVRFLAAGGRDGFHKVKILHDWVADNIAYDVEAYFSYDEIESSGLGTLKQRRGVCHGYGSLMEEMCALAGIPCRTISGYGRGYSFATGRNTDTDQENHVWNAIYINERWYLVDVTWDAGHVDGRSYKKEYCTTYLFMDPENFVYTHLPKEPRWQLLSAPLTAEQFRSLPYLRGVFFDHGLRLGTKLSRVTRAGESVQFLIRFSHEADMMAKLLTADDQELPRRTLVQREDRSCRVFVTFPNAGRYCVKLYCRPLGDTESMDLVADLDFRSTSGTTRTFPETYGWFGRMRGHLYSPLYTPLATNKPLLFKVRLHDAHDVSLAVDDEPWLDLVPSLEDKRVYQVKATIPDGARVRVNAKTSPDDDSYSTLIEFTEEK